MRRAGLGLAACMILGVPSTASAQELMISGTKLGVDFRNHTNVTLSVSGPKRFHMQSFSSGSKVALDLAADGAPPDGAYDYEITAASKDVMESLSKLDDGRDQGRQEERVEATVSGTFRIVDGKFAAPGKVDEKSDKDKI